MNRKIMLSTLIPIAIVSLLAQEARASVSRAWVLRDRDDFKEVKLDGVAAQGDGTFSLSARVQPVLDAAQPNLWCLARDGRGNLYAGSGNEGKVYRIPAGGGPAEVVFDADELAVHAVAIDATGSLHAATSPHGAVYRIDRGGSSEIIFDPEDAYIWSVAFDADNRMMVATGSKGRIYRVPRDGSKPEVLLDGPEEHIRSLAQAPDGSFYAGSDRGGILYRLDTRGKVKVVYDSPMQEISSLLVMELSGGGHEVYAATLAPLPRQSGGRAAPGSGGVTRVRVTADDPDGDESPSPGNGQSSEQQDESRQQKAQPAQRRPERFFGAVFRITPEGYARKIWESRQSLPLSLAGDGQGGVLIGTGNEGDVLRIHPAADATDFVKVSSEQITALLADGEGGYFAAGSNLGQVVRISPALAEEGTITSPALDADFTSTWGALSWTAQTPRGASISFRARTGNTEQPDDSWSDWSAPYTRATGTPIERPRARYLQWEATLAAGSGGGPVLKGVQISYLQDNLPPEITTLEVLDPGIVLVGSGGGGDGSPAARRAKNQPRRSIDKGRRAVLWKSEDINDDDLRFDVFFKAEDETLWKPLGRDLDVEFHTWDATAMPDGVYRIRVTASDAPSNPPGGEQSGSRVSSAFDVDNTPPVVEPVRTTVVKDPSGPGRAVDVSVTVLDSFSAITSVAYSIDAADWVPILPEDQIADSPREVFRFTTSALEPGEHTVTVKARDRAGNTSAAKSVVIIAD